MLRCMRRLTQQGPISHPFSSQSQHKPRPLDGIRVIECGHLIAGPFAGTILGYFGAQVIKIEPPQGDQIRTWRVLDKSDTSVWWHSIGRNKLSVAIDLKKKEGRAIVSELIQTSDVLIENFRPGQMEEWGLGPEVFKISRPELIYARISGYGQDGPYASRPGFASVCEAMGGFRYINGFPDRPSVRQNLSLGDTLAGLHAALGITMALIGRLRNTPGTGQVVDVAIYESVFNLMESIVPEYDYSGFIRQCSGSTITGIVPSNTYACKDNKDIVIAANTDKLFCCLMTAIDRTDMANNINYRSNADRVLHQSDIDNAILNWTKSKTLQEVCTILQSHKVPVGQVYSVKDMFSDPQYQSRNTFETVTIDDGYESKNLKIPAIMPKLQSTPGFTSFSGRKIGQDGRYVLQHILKKSDSLIDALKHQKIFFEP